VDDDDDCGWIFFCDVDDRFDSFLFVFFDFDLLDVANNIYRLGKKNKNK